MKNLTKIGLGSAASTALTEFYSLLNYGKDYLAKAKIVKFHCEPKTGYRRRLSMS